MCGNRFQSLPLCATSKGQMRAIVGLFLLMYFSSVFASPPPPDSFWVQPERCENYALVVKDRFEEYIVKRNIPHHAAISEELDVSTKAFADMYDGALLPEIVRDVIHYSIWFIYSKHMSDKAAWEVAAAYVDDCKRWLRTHKV